MSEDFTYFVYGTLKPGGLYWPRVSDTIAWYEPAKVIGELYDTGLGYPAAIFSGDGIIDGFLLHAIPAKADQARRVIDEIEDEGNEYRRVTVTTVSGVSAAGYEWNRAAEGLEPILAWPRS